MNQDLRIAGIDFDSPEHFEWVPQDPEDCNVWATVSVGDERGSVLFQVHVCTAASMKRIENKRHCFVVEQFIGKRDLIARLDAFIAEKTRGCTGDPYRVSAGLWYSEYGKYDKRGNLIG